MLTADEKRQVEDLKRKLKAFDGKKPPPLARRDGSWRTGPAPRRRRSCSNAASWPTRGRRSSRLPRHPVAGPQAGRLKIPATAAGTGRRLALAKWIASKDNPLTARVIVNRLWQHHFGRGIVATPSDFGTRGDRPDASRIARLAGV